MDRNIQVFEVPKSSQSISNKINLPDSFFEMTAMELKYAMGLASKKSKDEQNRPLMTKAMRDKQEQTREKKYPKTLIRVKFSDKYILQGTFLTEEKVSVIYDFVREHLEQKEKPFYLYMTPPLLKLNTEQIMSQNMYKAKLAPASILHFGWEDQSKYTGSFLSKEALKLVQELPAHPSVEKYASNNPNSEEKSNKLTESTSGIGEKSKSKESLTDSKGFKMPKWLKLGKK